jgi:predicted Zn-dependent peptidase
MVVLAVGGAAYGAVKLSQKDAQRVEEHTGASVEELTEEELVAAMKDLGIESIELSDEDKAALAAEGGQAEVGGATVSYEGQPQAGPAAPPAPPEAAPSYIEELEKLAALRDQGIISEEEFAAKKAQLLGL